MFSSTGSSGFSIGGFIGVCGIDSIGLFSSTGTELLSPLSVSLLSVGGILSFSTGGLIGFISTKSTYLLLFLLICVKISSLDIIERCISFLTENKTSNASITETEFEELYSFILFIEFSIFSIFSSIFFIFEESSKIGKIIPEDILFSINL